jgi:2-oxoisovalerate ferredoxin oxidoreductase alpha subunit
MSEKNKIMLRGNDAVIYGALLAGCDCFFGYPITPANEIAHSAAALFPLLGRIFIQAESEIAAINMVLGASATGKSAITASSGLGISLKQEGISYIATMELPAVIVDIMRGGPGLGNIGPEQGDYNQVVKGGGHGNYKCIVLAPNSPQEMCALTMSAFELADKYRTPVYVLADAVIGQMIESISLPDPVDKKPVPGWAIDGTREHRGNVITSIYLDHDDLENINIKLQEKYALIKEKEQSSESYLTEDAETVIICYGIVSRVAKSAVNLLREKGEKVGLLRPKTLFPFPVDEIRRLEKTAKSFICFELSNGQMLDDIRLSMKSQIPLHFFSRMGGNLPNEQDMLEKYLSFKGESR